MDSKDLKVISAVNVPKLTLRDSNRRKSVTILVVLSLEEERMMDTASIHLKEVGSELNDMKQLSDKNKAPSKDRLVELQREMMKLTAELDR